MTVSVAKYAAADMDYSFPDPADARKYVGEVARLWFFWLVGLAAVFLLSDWMLVAAAVALLVGAFLLTHPIQSRVYDFVDEDEVIGSKLQVVLGRGTKRDKVLRDLLYGEEPLRAALASAGMSPRWVWARWAVIVITIVAVVAVFLL